MRADIVLCPLFRESLDKADQCEASSLNFVSLGVQDTVGQNSQDSAGPVQKPEHAA